jgi:hypothetical protein
MLKFIAVIAWICAGVMAFWIKTIWAFICCIIAGSNRPPGVPAPSGVPWATGVLSICCNDCQRGKSWDASWAVTALDVPSSFIIPAANCRPEGPVAGVPLTDAGFDKSDDEPVSDDDPLDEGPLDEGELVGEEPADAPQAVNTNARMLNKVIIVIFFTWSPCFYKAVSIMKACLLLV